MPLPSFSTLTLSSHPASAAVVQVGLNRPEVHNAFNAVLIAELNQAFTQLGQNPDVRVIVLYGHGASFCAGADLNWMRDMLAATEEENQTDALALAAMLTAIKHCPKPVIARVHGGAYGGGIGLIAACDIAIAEAGTRFCLSEVKLGLIPAVIAPFVQPKIGESAMRRLTLTAETFSADTAHRYGLVHEVCEGSHALEAAETALLKRLLTNAPGAMAEAKRLIATVATPQGVNLAQWTSAQIAARRVSAEGQEGMRAFLDKRSPNWRPSSL